VIQIDTLVERYYDGDYNKLSTYVGQVAEGFDSTGAGVQYELPLSVEWLEELGLIKKIER
jgi:hypothetical protein